MTDDLLHAYDDQLRTEAEVADADSVTRLGPLWLATFEADRSGFVTYHDLDGCAGAEVDRLISGAVAYFRDETTLDEVEWKTRGHDRPVDLPARLIAQGFAAQDRETVMIGEAAALAVDVALPEGVVVRRAGDGTDLRHDVERAMAMQERVFGRSHGTVDGLVRDLQEHPDLRGLWIAEADGDVVSAGRLSVVPGTSFAGLWGGSTDERFRKRGIYRALTSARARHALTVGVRYLHSDSTDMSKPILERSGLRAVTTTTPYIWTRDDRSS